MTAIPTVCRLLAAFSVAALPAAVRAQCANVADLTAGTTANNNTDRLTDFFGERLFFAGYFPATSGELWTWDPTNGAHIVVDLAPGTATSNPQQLTPGTTPAGPRLFYSAFEIGHGHELYISDGTAGGTGRIKEIRPGSGSSLVHDFCAVGERMFFVADDGTHGDELWLSDGTGVGTQLVVDIRPGTLHGRPQYPCALDDVLLFSADDGVNGRELWRSDGTAAGTWMVKDIRTGPSSSQPFELTRAGDAVYFMATTDSEGGELWRSDGTAAGTWMVADLAPGTYSTTPTQLTPCGELLFFKAGFNPFVNGLCVTDGTTAGTMALGIDATGLTCSGDRLFFAGNHFPSGRELWTSDGTVAGTQLVLDQVPGATGANPYEITPCAGGVCYVSSDVAGADIWFSDGTAAGTQPVCWMDPSGSWPPYELTMCRGHLFFHAYHASYGLEIFWIETPGASTTVLGPSGAPGYPTLTTGNGATPTLGSTIDIVGHGPTNQFAVLLGNLMVPPLPAPFVPGFLLGGTDWVGIQLGSAIQLAVTATPDTSWPLFTPNDPALEGTIYRLQQLWWDPVGPTPFQLSNGLQVVLGTAAPH